MRWPTGATSGCPDAGTKPQPHPRRGTIPHRLKIEPMGEAQNIPFVSGNSIFDPPQKQLFDSSGTEILRFRGRSVQTQKLFQNWNENREKSIFLGSSTKSSPK
jgi:hypothetical protein